MPKWTRPTEGPPPLFVNKPEKDFQKQIADEVQDFVLPYEGFYFAVDAEKTKWHPIYKESIEKFYFDPIYIRFFADYEDQNTKTTKYGTDRKSKMVFHFHKRRINEDLNIEIKEGDLIYYNEEYHEIIKLSEPEALWDQIHFKNGITAYCEKNRNVPLFKTK